MRFIITNPMYMKTTKTILSVFVAATIILSSCATNKIAKVQISSEIKESKESTTSTFVKMKDGSIVYYTSLKLVKGVFSAPHLLADGKIKIMPSEIVAYQSEDHYSVSQSTFSSGRKSFVAVETLPGFAVRVVKGKLNIYCKKFFNGRAAINEFYIQSGNDGKIFTYSPELMKKMIQDNQVALTYFNDDKKDSDISKKLQTTAEMYNSTLLMSKN